MARLGLVISNGQNAPTSTYYSNLAQNIAAKPRPAVSVGGNRFGSMIGAIHVQKQGCGCGKKVM
jgi:hypothetical protein